MESRARVTVVTCSHNYGRYVLDAVRSAIADPWPCKQVIVYDDGSSDGTFEQLYGHLRPVNRHNGDELVWVGGYFEDTSIPLTIMRGEQAKGPSFARNQIIKHTWDETDVFAVLDADDVFLPGKLAKTVPLIEADPKNVGCIYGDYETVDIHTGAVKVEFKEPFSRERLVNECIVHSACVINKRAFELVGGYDESFRVCEDFELWHRISERMMILHVPEVLMRVRVGSHGSASTVRNEVWQDSWRRVREKLIERNGGVR